MTRGDDERRLWGGETEKAILNLRISGEPMPQAVIRWLGRIKEAAALVNGELGLLRGDMATRIAAAASRIAKGEFMDQFPIDVFQTGSGTSTHMNVNEVIATVAGADVHPNDHVNMCQSSNCVVPSAVHLASLDGLIRDLVPALRVLEEALASKASAFRDITKAGRTHLMDAVPVTLGQEFSGYATQVRQGVARLDATRERLGQVPLGGTATGSGLNVHPEFARRVRLRLTESTSLPIGAPADPFEATGARDSLVETSGALRTVAVSLLKIANDVRLLASGPRTGLGEIVLPELQKGSSMMPGKVNPVIPEVVSQVAVQVVGNDAAVAMAGSHGHLELNAFVPVIARNLLESIALLSAASHAFAHACVAGIEANLDSCRRSAAMTLSSATGLVPYVGYDVVEELVREAQRTGKPLREVALQRGVGGDVIERALDPLVLARGGSMGLVGMSGA